MCRRKNYDPYLPEGSERSLEKISSGIARRWDEWLSKSTSADGPVFAV
jgi:hypothetical protein